MARPPKIYSEAALARYKAYGDKYAKRAAMSSGVIRSWNAGAAVEGKIKVAPGRYKYDRRLQGVGYTIWWRDEITPATMMWEVGMDLAAALPAARLQAAIPKNIANIYDMGGKPRWRPSKKMGRIRRMKRRGGESVLAKRGERTLYRSGRLATTVHALPAHIKVFKIPAREGTPPPKSRTIVMTGLGEGFATAEYVWHHEMGTRNMPRRPFIFQGVQEGWNEAMSSMVLGLKTQYKIGEAKAKAMPTPRLLVHPLQPVPVPISVQMKMYAPKERMTAFALMWWLLPPSQLWAVVGGGSDLAAILSGEMLQSRYLLPWLQALALGKISTMVGVPLTKKYARRGFRRRMYRGRGKYKR